MTAQAFPIEAGHVVLFRRALGELLEHSLPTEPVVPPTFVQAAAHFDPEYPHRQRPGKPWVGSGARATGAPAATGDGGTRLHAEQHFEYHHPVRIGDVLHCTTRLGATWEKQGRRGKLIFTEVITEFWNQDGIPVVTSRAVGVRVERAGEHGA